MLRIMLLFAVLFATSGLAESMNGQGVSSPYYDAPNVLVATVSSVSEGKATNANPPQVELKVHQVLRGGAAIGDLHAIWSPPPHDIDTTGRENEIEAWKAKPMKKPNVSDKFILFGWIVDGDDGPKLTIHGYGKRPFTPAVLETERKIIKQREAEFKK